MKGKRNCLTMTDITVERTLLNGYRALVVLQPSNNAYSGKWKNNKKYGFGTEKHKNGYTFDGNFKENQRHGFGTLRRQNDLGVSERVYIGDWLANKKHGEGRQFYANGSIYYGLWENGQRHGHGIMWYEAPQRLYIGEWKNGKHDGVGVLFTENRDRYAGYFRDGMKNGEGTFYHMHTGQIQKGMWLDDVCVTSVMEDVHRQRCDRPTPYPIPKNLLLEPNEVIKRSFRNYLNIQDVNISAFTLIKHYSSTIFMIN